MPFIANVIYPNPPDSQFDMDYYLQTHMPLVSEVWQKYGLQKWEVIKLNQGRAGARPEFRTQAILTWESEEAFQKGMGAEEAKTVFGDIPAFTNTSPILVAGPSIQSKIH